LVIAMQRWHKTFLGLMATAWCLAVPAATDAATLDVDTDAQLRPSRISLDQSAELRVTAKAGGAAALPQVDGLHFQRAGERSEMSDINGVRSQHHWILYRVVADRPGTFSIPIGPHPLALEVTPATGGSAPASSRALVPRPAGASSAQPGASEGPLAFLRVRLPKRRIYVGQSVPIRFKAYFRAGTEVSLAGAPGLGVPAFTIGKLDEEPRQTDETVRGVPYRVATWTGEVSAAMPGMFTTQATLPIVVRYRATPQQPAANPFASMLDGDDDLFSGSASAMLRSFMKRSAFGGDLGDMFGQVREREMTLSAPAQRIDVQSLPSAGQPANYGGAVGSFEVRTSLAPSTGTLFAPMTLTIEVSGKGNLDRVTLAGLPSSADWKTYPASAKLTAPESKSFVQAVVPQRSGHLELPAISLGFFDPEQRQYLTRSSTPIGVDVTAAAPGAAMPSLAAVVPQAAAHAAAGLRPNRVDEGRFVANLLPPYRHTWFWPLVALPWLALAMVVARPYLRLPSSRVSRRAAGEAVARYRLEMKSALAGQDVLRFYEAAAAALRVRLGWLWQIPPDDVTAAEATARLGPDDAPVIGVLDAAERLRYGGAVAEPTSLADLQVSVDEKLGQPEERS
jgi:hypothetical protein